MSVVHCYTDAGDEGGFFVPDVLTLAKTFVTQFYMQGATDDTLASAEDDVIVLGSRTLHYGVGKEEARRALKEEFRSITPCKLFRNRLRVQQEGPLTVVIGTLVLRMASGPTAVVHRLTLIFRAYEAKDGKETEYRLKCIRINRSLRREEMYRRVCTRMLHSVMAAKLGKAADDTNDIVSALPAAFISYVEDEGVRHLTYYGDMLWRMLGYDSEAAFLAADGANIERFMEASERRQTHLWVEKQLAFHAHYSVEFSIRGADGQPRRVIGCGHRVIDADGSSHIDGALIDITELKLTSERLAYQVAYDELTGLYNKTAFMQKMRELIADSPGTAFEIMCLDIERFSVINDLFGVETADSILRYLGDFFKSVQLEKSLFSRFHSDVFVLFYPADEANRKRFLKSIKVLASSFTLSYRVILRFGVYRVEDLSLPTHVMCDRAFLALAKAKASGLLDLCEYDESMRDGLVLEQSIINAMDEALQRREFLVYMQPKYDVTTERIVGAEALVRWNHPTRGFISPGEFVPVFEHNGFIFQVDQFVWEETCRLLRKWLDEGRDPVPVSVNVSRVDFYSTQLVTIIDKLVRKYHIPPELLELEITESAYTENPQEIIAVVKRLQSMGFKILMDDFGSGYSSLNMLKEMPVDVLKIDLKFLDDKNETGRGGNILNSVVRMAKWMNIPVVVEGVETRGQVEFLRAIGCSFVQGYYFSRPVPVDEYEKLLAESGSHVRIAKEEEALSASDINEFISPNTQLNLIFNSITNAIGIYELANGTLELLRANNGFLALSGMDLGEAFSASKNAIENIFEADRESAWNTIYRAIESKQQTECDLRRYCKDGSLRWVRVGISVILHEEARTLLFVTMEDVTESYDLPKLFRDFANNYQGGFAILDINEKQGNVRIVFMNRWLRELDGLSEDDFRRKGAFDAKELLGEGMNEFVIKEALKAEHMPPGSLHHCEYPFRAADGREMWLRAYLSTVRSEKRFLAYCNIVDVTARHREMTQSDTRILEMR